VEPDLALIEQRSSNLRRRLAGGPRLRHQPAAAGIQQWPRPTPTPIFIVGLPRTGTTLAERILSSHSQVESAGEILYLPAGDAAACSRPGAARSRRPPWLPRRAAPPERNRARYLEAIESDWAASRYFIEKLPENFLYLGFIARAFPDARLVHLRRHPMDACFALYKQSYFRYAYSLEDLGRYYLAHDRLLRHWRAVLGERLVELVTRPWWPAGGPRPALLARLGLPFEPACLEFERNALGGGHGQRRPGARKNAHALGRQMAPLRPPSWNPCGNGWPGLASRWTEATAAGADGCCVEVPRYHVAQRNRTSEKAFASPCLTPVLAGKCNIDASGMSV
jgi:hypothetical protein